MRRGPVRLVLMVALAGAAVGCAHTGPLEGNRFGHDDWERALHRAGVDGERVVYPFESSPDIDQWVRSALAKPAGRDPLERLQTLQSALFQREFHFTYEEDLTLTAAEAFRERRGNCMSFTVLFVTMARSAGIPAFLMSVRRTPEVDRDEDLVVVNRHVVAGYRGPHQVYVFDFYVTSEAPFIQQFVIDDVLASAMYHNNLGGAAIRRGDEVVALRHLEVATALAPRWAPAWVNLGVARFRSRDTTGAVVAYKKALEVEPDNPSALTNMAYVYRQLGMTEEANTALRAAALRTTNPFTLIAMADAEMVRGDSDSASRYLRKARWWYRDEPAVWEAMARLAEQEGDQRAAAKHAARASRLREQAAEASGSEP